MLMLLFSFAYLYFAPFSICRFSVIVSMEIVEDEYVGGKILYRLVLEEKVAEPSTWICHPALLELLLVVDFAAYFSMHYESARWLSWQLSWSPH